MVRSSHLPWLILTVGGVLLGGLWAAGARRTSPVAAAPPAEARPVHADERHYVSPRQLADANAMIAQGVGPLRATAHDGRDLGWDDLSGGKPVVLVFVKDGCPCNADVEPFVQRVEARYRDTARFARVIDADVAAAARYAREQGVESPVLADPGQRLIRHFG